MGSKISGELIGEFNGLRIYGRVKKATRRGQDRLWLRIRQGAEKNWRIAATLSYTNSMDVRFESSDGGAEDAQEVEEQN
jgi:hypothetical protein